MDMFLSICGVACEVTGDEGFVSAIAQEHSPYQVGNEETPTIRLSGSIGQPPAIPEGAILVGRAGGIDHWRLGCVDWFVNPSSHWSCTRDDHTLHLHGIGTGLEALRELGRVLLEVGVTYRSESLGLTPLHSSAVAIEKRGILLQGESGYGKSTLATTLCRLHHATLIADDTTFYDPTTGRVSGFLPHIAIYSDQAPSPDSFTYSSGVRRRLINPLEIGPMTITPVPPVAVVLLQPVWGQNSRLLPLRHRTAFSMLASTVAPGIKPFFSLHTDDGPLVKQRLEALHHLLQRSPAYQLQAGRDPVQAAELLADEVARLGRPTAMSSQGR